MSKIRRALLSAVLLVPMVTIACGGPAYYAYRVPPPPPPPRVYGPVGYAPGTGYVWASGYYDLRGTRWVWAPGYWVRPPRLHSVWVTPYWEPHGHAYRFHRGYWR
jgi:hypothetical protein